MRQRRPHMLANAKIFFSGLQWNPRKRHFECLNSKVNNLNDKERKRKDIKLYFEKIKGKLLVYDKIYQLT